MDDVTLWKRQQYHFLLQRKWSSVLISINVAEFLNSNFPEDKVTDRQANSGDLGP
jgi:hypothetical protein